MLFLETSMDSGIKYQPGVNYRCSNDEVQSMCIEKIDRVRLDNMNKPPHSLIGAIICVGPGGFLQYGTGILLSRDIVLTCAHVIYSVEYKRYYQRIIFYPGIYGDLTNWYKVQDFKAPQQYENKKPWLDSRSYDYALLKLQKKVNQSKFIPLCQDLSTISKNQTLQIYGYPLSKYKSIDGRPQSVKQYGLKRSGYILDLFIEAGYIVHRISTEAGQSGAPVFRTDSKGVSSIIGLHIGSTEQKIQKYQQKFPELSKINMIRVLNKLMIKRLTLFAKQLKGETFKVESENILYRLNPEKVTSNKSKQYIKKQTKKTQFPKQYKNSKTPNKVLEKDIKTKQKTTKKGVTYKKRPRISQNEIEQYRQIFNLFKNEATGKVNLKQLKSSILSLGYESKFQKITQLQCQTKQIDFEEFLDIIPSSLGGDQQTRNGINYIFDLFDYDKSGTINLNNIKRAAKQLGEMMSVQELEEMLRSAASNGRDISREDFYNMMTKKTF